MSGMLVHSVHVTERVVLVAKCGVSSARMQSMEQQWQTHIVVKPTPNLKHSRIATLPVRIITCTHSRLMVQLVGHLHSPRHAQRIKPSYRSRWILHRAQRPFLTQSQQHSYGIHQPLLTCSIRRRRESCAPSYHRQEQQDNIGWMYREQNQISQPWMH